MLSRLGNTLQAIFTKGRGRAYVMVRLVLCASCALLGFLAMSQYKSLQKTPEEKFVEGKTRAELASDYITLFEKHGALLKRNSELSAEVSSLEAAQDDEAGIMSVLRGEAQAVIRQAGLADVNSGGIRVIITPSEKFPVTSSMLIQFVNEIKAADASAIAVSGQRVVPMTEIRDTVSGFTVNGVPYSYDDPITIDAAGNGVDMYGALQMVGGILDKWEQSHIDVHVDIVNDMTVPALAEDIQARMDLSAYADVSASQEDQ